LNDVFILTLSPKPGKQAEAFTAVMNEWVRAYKFGFSKGEIERAVSETISGYENYLEKLNEISHKQVIGMVKDDYLNHEVIADPVAEFEMAKSILNNLNTKILQEQISKLYTEKNRVITVRGVEGEENLNQENAFTIIQKAENDTSLKPYTDTFEGKTILGDLKINSGKIVLEKKETAIDATTFVLSNGVKVHYKFADKNKKEVELVAESPGGTSLYEPQDLPSIGRTTTLAMMSGVGELSNVDLDKVLKGKIANSSVNISSLKETVTGSANVKDIETMMQLVHLRFAQPRFDNQMYALLKQRLENSLKNRANDINAKMDDSLSAVIYGKNNPRVQPFNQKYIDDLSFDKMKTFYLDRFADVSNFEFYIVGDVTPEVLKPLLEKYIASIKGIKRKEKFKKDAPEWISKKIDRDVFIEMKTPKSSVHIILMNDYAYSQRNKILNSFLSDILTLRYTESLREKEGGTYGAQVKGGLKKDPVAKGGIHINFDCDAEKVEHLLPIVYQEIDKIKKGEIAPEDIEKTRTNYLKSREDSKNFNSYSMSVLSNYFEEGYNMNETKNYEDIVKSITATDIQKFANSLLGKADSMEVVFKPLQQK
jgi:zinc protease